MYDTYLPNVQNVVPFAADVILVEDKVAVATIEVAQPFSVHRTQLVVLYPPSLREKKHKSLFNLLFAGLGSRSTSFACFLIPTAGSSSIDVSVCNTFIKVKQADIDLLSFLK